MMLVNAVPKNFAADPNPHRISTDPRLGCKIGCRYNKSLKIRLYCGERGIPLWGYSPIFAAH